MDRRAGVGPNILPVMSMSAYWLKDAKGLVVGPIGLGAVRDLAALRGEAFTHASIDGKTWLVLSDLPEVAEAVRPASVAQRHARERQEAQRIALQLDRYEELATHELFGVPKRSDLKTYRQGFIALAKPYHPARLPKDVHPDLLKACMEMFQFLSGRMVLVERELKASEAAAPPKPTAPETVVSLRRAKSGRIEAHIAVDYPKAPMFTEHPLVNLSTNGFFVRAEKTIPLGTSLDVVLSFPTEQHELRARGSVVWENAPPNPVQPHGFAIRLDKLTDGERAFLNEFLVKAASASSGSAGA